jgi:hemerythrin
MDFIEWSEELSVGIPEIDAEHRRLIDLVNAFHERLMSRQLARPEIEAGLAALAAEVKAHFASEESYLERIGSFRLESHRILHEILYSDLEVMIAEARRDNFRFLFEDLECSFMPWLVEHIRNVDSRLTA